MNYVSTFDVACLTETFADSTFDFSGMFTKYKKKKNIAPIKKKITKKLTQQGRRSDENLLLIRIFSFFFLIS